MLPLQHFPFWLTIRITWGAFRNPDAQPCPLPQFCQNLWGWSWPGSQFLKALGTIPRSAQAESRWGDPARRTLAHQSARCAHGQDLGACWRSQTLIPLVSLLKEKARHGLSLLPGDQCSQSRHTGRNHCFQTLHRFSPSPLPSQTPLPTL